MVKIPLAKVAKENGEGDKEIFSSPFKKWKGNYVTGPSKRRRKKGPDQDEDILGQFSGAHSGGCESECANPPKEVSSSAAAASAQSSEVAKRDKRLLREDSSADKDEDDRPRVTSAATNTDEDDLRRATALGRKRRLSVNDDDSGSDEEKRAFLSHLNDHVPFFRDLAVDSSKKSKKSKKTSREIRVTKGHPVDAVPIIPKPPPLKRKRGRPTVHSKLQEELWFRQQAELRRRKAEEAISLDGASFKGDESFSAPGKKETTATTASAFSEKESPSFSLGGRSTNSLDGDERAVGKDSTTNKSVKIPPSFCKLSLENVVFTKRGVSNSANQEKKEDNGRTANTSIASLSPKESLTPSSSQAQMEREETRPTEERKQNYQGSYSEDDLFTPVDGFANGEITEAYTDQGERTQPPQAAFFMPVPLLDAMDSADMTDLDNLIIKEKCSEDHTSSFQRNKNNANATETAFLDSSNNKQHTNKSKEGDHLRATDAVMEAAAIAREAVSPSAVLRPRSSELAIADDPPQAREQSMINSSTTGEGGGEQKSDLKDAVVGDKPSLTLQQVVVERELQRRRRARERQNVAMEVVEERSEWLVCKITGCSYWTTKPERMKRHQDCHESPFSKHFKCPDCGVKIFSLAKMLSHDRRNHTGIKDYECRLCGAEVNDIAVHLKVRCQGITLHSG